MDVYLPIANLSVNGLWIVALGALTGVLSGLFGVGGGFLTTPLLIFYGIPPTVAAASASTQVTGASVSGVVAHSKRKGVDYRMGSVMVGGGVIGAAIGALLFRFFRSIGQIDVVINALYVVLLGSIGMLMAKEGLQVLRGTAGKQAARRRHHPLVANLPWRWRFYGSGLYISPLAPALVGVVVGSEGASGSGWGLAISCSVSGHRCCLCCASYRTTLFHAFQMSDNYASRSTALNPN